MSDHRTKSGARLHTETRVIRRGLAQMTDADYVQPRCKTCNKALHDDRMVHERKYCSKACQTTSVRRRRGVAVGRATKWRAFYAAARAANGAWVVHVCPDVPTAARLVISMNQRRDFQGVRNGASVSARLVVAA